jgi:REP element-mobilizing transposase RayT
MPDHLHWLVQVNSRRSLSESVSVVKSSAARQINALSGSPMRVWQRGFYDRAIREEEDLADIARYIVANPVRAGLVRSIKDYPHWDAVWLK